MNPQSNNPNNVPPQTMPESAMSSDIPPAAPQTPPSPMANPPYGAPPAPEPTMAAPQTPPPAYEQGTPTITSGGGSGGKKIFVLLGAVLLLAALGIGAYVIANRFIFPAQQEGQPTTSPVADEEVTALCLNIKAYDENWIRLSLSDLSSLQPGTKIRITVSGDTSSGNFDMARFSVNSVTLGETTQLKPETQEFYDEYVIPVDVQSFSIEAQLHHQQLDQWI